VRMNFPWDGQTSRPAARASKKEKVQCRGEQRKKHRGQSQRGKTLRGRKREHGQTKERLASRLCNESEHRVFRGNRKTRGRQQEARARNFYRLCHWRPNLILEMRKMQTRDDGQNRSGETSPSDPLTKGEQGRGGFVLNRRKTVAGNVCNHSSLQG